MNEIDGETGASVENNGKTPTTDQKQDVDATSEADLGICILSQLFCYVDWNLVRDTMHMFLNLPFYIVSIRHCFRVIAEKKQMDMEYDEISDDDLDELIENADADDEQESGKPGMVPGIFFYQ